MVGDDVLLLYGGGNTMPLNYVENTASLLAECGRHPAAAGLVLNAVDPDPPTQREYAKASRAAGGLTRVVTVPLWLLRRSGPAWWLRAGAPTVAWVRPDSIDPYVVEPMFRSFGSRPVPRPADRMAAAHGREEAYRRTFASAAGGPSSS